MTPPKTLFATHIQLGLGDLCNGFTMKATVQCFDHCEPCCVACFHHGGVHYHMGMQCLPGKEPIEMAWMVMTNPRSAIDYILSTFLALPAETRETMIQDGDHNHVV